MSLINRIENLNKTLFQQFMSLDKENQRLKEELEKEEYPFGRSDGVVAGMDRRVFHINVGNLPTGKAEEYIKQLMKKYKRKTIGQNPLSTTEDYYFT